jgi:MFS family permease
MSPRTDSPTYGTVSSIDSIPSAIDDTSNTLDESSSSSSSSSTTTKRNDTSVDEEMDRIGFGRFHIAMVSILSLANASDAVELLSVSFILPSLSKDTFSDTDRSVLSSAAFVGMLIGGLAFGVIADIAGRRFALVTSLFISAVFTILRSIAPESPSYILSLMMVLAGFGVGGSIPGVFSLTAELLPSKNRGFYITLVAWGWMFGSLFAAACAWLIIGILGKSWRIFAAVCATPALLACLLIWFVLPESPRYLWLSGRVREAEDVLILIGKWNNVKRERFNLKSHPSSISLGQSVSISSSSIDSISLESISSNSIHTHSLEMTSTTTTNVSKLSNKHSDNVFVVGKDTDDEIIDGIIHKNDGPISVTPVNTLIIDRKIRVLEQQGKLYNPKQQIGGIEHTLPSSPSATSEREMQIGLTSGNMRLSITDFRNWYALGKEPILSFFSPELRRTSILLMIVWFTLSLGWYGLTLWIPTIFAETDVALDPYQDAFLVQAANLPGNILSSFLVERIGRKKVLSYSLVFACIAAIGFPFAKTEVVVVLCACLLNAASTMSWNALDCLSTESFPTSLRSTAMGLLAATGRIGSIIGQFIFGALIHVSLFALLGVAGAILLSGAVAAMLLPKEYSGERLKDLADEE